MGCADFLTLSLNHILTHRRDVYAGDVAKSTKKAKKNVTRDWIKVNPRLT